MHKAFDIFMASLKMKEPVKVDFWNFTLVLPIPRLIVLGVKLSVRLETSKGLSIQSATTTTNATIAIFLAKRFAGTTVHTERGNPTPYAISFHAFFFFSASLKLWRPLSYKIRCFSTSTVSSSVLSDMLSTSALQSQFFYAYRVSPGPSYTKTKELIGWQEIVRATIA